MGILLRTLSLFFFVGLFQPATSRAQSVDRGGLDRPETKVTASITRQALLDQFYRERKLLVVFGADASQDREHVRRAIQESAWRWRMDMQVQHVDDVQDAALDGGAVLLVGTPMNNPFIRRMAAELPVDFQEEGFSFLGKKYTEAGDVLNLVYPNPQNPQYPLFVTVGRQKSAILGALNDRLRLYDYQIQRNGQRIRLGNFSQVPADMWQYDADKDLDFEEDIKLVGSTEHFRFYAHNNAIDHGMLSGIFQAREVTHANIEAFLSGAASKEDDKPYRYFLYASLQDKAVITKSMQFAHVDHDQQAVHIAIEEGIRGDILNKEASLILRQRLGMPAIQALEDGLGIVLSHTWFGKPYQHWADRIMHADLYMTAEALLDNERYNRSSPLIREVLAASMVSCMIDAWGKEVFLDHYASWQPAPHEWHALNYEWGRCLDKGKARYTPVAKREMPANGAFQKGFNFAHEGYGIVNGYGSRSADDALAKLKAMGSNAVSIIPYTFMRNPNQPIPLRLPNTAGDENDGAVAHATKVAERLGFTTMMKPQIWLRGSWPGDIEMSSAEGWEDFFGHYEHWITHYALLSELFEVDILCIGTELSKATMFDETQWANFARNLRSIYSGQLVYAPNWGEEFESLSFWDAFDYIGLNSYYPLSALDDPSDADLLKGAAAVVKRMERVYKRHKKPILLTEIGFPNSPNPWKLPYQEDRRAPANPEHQARCYKAMVEALSGVDFLQGIYWWKWPSYLERGGMDHRGFTPNRKLAERIVADWYQSF